MFEHIKSLQGNIDDKEIARRVEDEYNEKFDSENLSIEEIFRIVRDKVAGMTDKFALDQYQRLSGQNI